MWKQSYLHAAALFFKFMQFGGILHYQKGNKWQVNRGRTHPHSTFDTLSCQESYWSQRISWNKFKTKYCMMLKHTNTNYRYRFTTSRTFQKKRNIKIYLGTILSGNLCVGMETGSFCICRACSNKPAKLWEYKWDAFPEKTIWHDTQNMKETKRLQILVLEMSWSERHAEKSFCFMNCNCYHYNFSLAQILTPYLHRTRPARCDKTHGLL